MYHEYIKYQPFSIFAINFNFDNNYGCKLLIYLLIYLIINNLSGLLILFLNYSSEFPVTWTFVQLLWIEGTLDTILTSSPIKKKYNKSWSMNSFAIFWSLLRSIDFQCTCHKAFCKTKRLCSSKTVFPKALSKERYGPRGYHKQGQPIEPCSRWNDRSSTKKRTRIQLPAVKAIVLPRNSFISDCFGMF